VTFYSEDGNPFVRCERCTPDGVPCDRFQPSDPLH
jgi:hypothetical protein